jgi:hypothetical protein
MEYVQVCFYSKIIKEGIKQDLNTAIGVNLKDYSARIIMLAQNSLNIDINEYYVVDVAKDYSYCIILNKKEVFVLCNEEPNKKLINQIIEEKGFVKEKVES